MILRLSCIVEIGGARVLTLPLAGEGARRAGEGLATPSTHVETKPLIRPSATFSPGEKEVKRQRTSRVEHEMQDLR